MNETLRSLGRQVRLHLYAYKDAEGAEREWRPLELEWLEGIQYEVCTAKERQQFLDNSMKPVDRIRRRLTGRKDRTVRESAVYMPEIFEMDEVYLYGFWGCEKYYEDIIPLLQAKIVFPESSDPRNAALMRSMAGENAVSVHLRRKDYLTVADGKRYMGICTDAYYKGAIRYITERVERPVFYIFSDDPAFARAQFCGENMHVVDWNTGRESLQDMALMSRCRHNICANSTFSIWGARLNRHPNKIMIRPLHHDNYETLDAGTLHAYWQGWVLMDADGNVC